MGTERKGIQRERTARHRRKYRPYTQTRRRVQTMYTDQEEENRPCAQIKRKRTDHVHRSRRRVQATCTDQDEVSVRHRFDPWIGKIFWRRKMATHSSILA